MKLAWLCNMTPGVVSRCRGTGGGGLWLDHVLDDLCTRQDVSMRLFCPGGTETGRVDEKTDYVLLAEGAPQSYRQQLEDLFYEQLQQFQPDALPSIRYR